MRIKFIGVLLTTLFMINSVTADGFRGPDTGFIGAPVDCEALNPLSPEYQQNCVLPDDQETILYSYVSVKETYYVNGVEVEMDAKYQMTASTNPISGVITLIKIMNVRNEFTIVCPQCTYNEMLDFVEVTAQDYADNRFENVLKKLHEAADSLNEIESTYHAFKSVIATMKELIFQKGIVFVEDGQGNIIGIASFKVYNIDLELDMAEVEINELVELRPNEDPQFQSNDVDFYQPFNGNGNLIDSSDPLIRNIPGYECRWVRIRLPETQRVSAQRVCGVWK
ncbi:MAG: hypothetical protein KJO69_08905 [Gammaproteobacteria bacterium]|nr:hypothetical protein [Gammaproteobacteria bacterium]NNJ71700.1 hypothetical protein [Enterobacterales bacterium]